MDHHSGSFRIKQSSETEEALHYIVTKGINDKVVKRACKELGIDQDHLLPKPMTLFEEKNNNKETVKIRFLHYEARRRAQLLVVAEYLVENNIFVTDPFKRVKIERSQSSSSPRKLKSHSSVYIPLSPEKIFEKKMSIARKNMIKRLKVKENREKLRESEESLRQIMDQKLKTKLSKSEKREKPEKKRYFENHEKRIKDILMKKYRELDEHEEKALNSLEIRKEESKIQSISKPVLPKKLLSVIFIKNEDDFNKIEHELLKINSKLSNSAERAKKALLSKVKSSNHSKLMQKAKKLKESIDSKIEEEKTKKILRMNQSLIESTVKTIQKRREENFFNENQKRAKSSKIFEEKRVEDKLKAQQEIIEKEKMLEMKEVQREKMRQEIKQNNDQKALMASREKFLRKKKQERNLKQINRELLLIKKNLIEKYKDSDFSKSRKDFSKIKAKLELEFRNSGNKDIFH